MSLDENEPSAELPNAGQHEFPNAVKLPIRATKFTQSNQRVGYGWGGRVLSQIDAALRRLKSL
ncbi:hypothetical protein [Bradyrhizobium sp. cf659]|uniref:hypothetical protein n=1 Tax=Bradyrhizobium sp. cf659 TaxID=1761771 RepID=UPI0011609E74|nr:hypothetical protein [Bradyrhizobium sp. cf659]